MAIKATVGRPLVAHILNIKLIMKIYIIRHGQDDASVRGGWSDTPLTAFGIQQSNKLADELFQNQSEYNICKIYSSDLKRARQTAQIIADKLSVPIEFVSERLITESLQEWIITLQRKNILTCIGAN